MRWHTSKFSTSCISLLAHNPIPTYLISTKPSTPPSLNSSQTHPLPLLAAQGSLDKLGARKCYRIFPGRAQAAPRSDRAANHGSLHAGSLRCTHELLFCRRSPLLFSSCSWDSVHPLYLSIISTSFVGFLFSIWSWDLFISSFRSSGDESRWGF